MRSELTPLNWVTKKFWIALTYSAEKLALSNYIVCIYPSNMIQLTYMKTINHKKIYIIQH